MLSAPPRDSNGVVVKHDHEGIKPSDHVIRLLSHHHIIDDSNIGGKRVSSAAFQASTTGNNSMSVDLKELIESHGIDSKEFASREPWLGSVLLNVNLLRTNSFQVGYDPIATNEFHGGVWGNFNKAAKKLMTNNHTIYTWPTAA